jgi:MFS transporter, ACS family, tartrate transporter
LFEVPSNIILEKLGARIWIARIMVTWGLLSGATAFSVGPWSFLTMRFLPGLAEAGLFPGMILFFTYWFPDWHRARIVSGFMVALPLAVAAGAPMSTALLELNGLWGLAGWQWMFIAEAIPTVVVGIFVLFCVTDRPHLAQWLGEDERGWLISTLETEWRLVGPNAKSASGNRSGIRRSSVTACVGMLLFLPQIIKQLGLTNMQVGWVTTRILAPSSRCWPGAGCRIGWASDAGRCHWRA